MADLRRHLSRWGDLQRDRRYRPNLIYNEADAAVYHSLLREFRPAQVLEVGSGLSTAVALDTIETHRLATRIRCVEPNPARLRSILRPEDDVPLHAALVQDVPLEVFDELDAGDVLFIDSTHVAKAGSDVVWTTLRILPRLSDGVLVHVHDIFWPWEYPEKWLRRRRDWNEIYLLHAFLSGHAGWRVLFWNDLIWQTRPDLVQRHLPGSVGARPGGLWLEKLA